MIPEIVPGIVAIRWYTCSGTPAASVHVFGITRPRMWPMNTKRTPKWNSGDAQRRMVGSFHCEERDVQPYWSVL